MLIIVIIFNINKANKKCLGRFDNFIFYIIGLLIHLHIVSVLYTMAADEAHRPNTLD